MSENKISIYETVTSKVDGKVSKTQTPRQKPGAAWKKSGNYWVKPKAPAGQDVAWDDNKGWITAASQATAWEIPLAIINSDKGPNSLSSLFEEAWNAQKSGEEWTKERFIAELQKRPWYKSKSAAQRNYYTLSKDPAQRAEFDRQIKSNAALIKDAAGMLGAKLSDADAVKLANANLQNGLNESELNDLIVGYVSYAGKNPQEVVGSLFGAAGDAEDQIREWATKNNVVVSDSWVLGEAKAIASKNYDINKSKDYITNLAKQQYSAWSDRLNNNTSLEDLARGYIQTYAFEMDDDVNNVTIKNPIIQSAMRTTDDQGKPVSNEAFIKTIRKQDAWADVSKNKNKIIGLADGILSKFGMR